LAFKPYLYGGTDINGVEYYVDGDHVSDKSGNHIHGIVQWRSGSTSYYVDGLLHREDGPAVKSINGAKDWWLNGREIIIDDLTKWHLVRMRKRYPKLYESIVEELAKRYL
jgi:hypothetical protein